MTLTDTFYTVFEAEKLGFPGALVIFWSIVVVLGVLLAVFRKKIKIIGVLLMAFFIAMFAYMGVNAATDRVKQNKSWEAYTAGTCLVVEGEITSFNDTGIEVQGQDSFYVDIERFQTGFVTGYGYKITKLGGGVLDDGVYVRITYNPAGLDNVIMKLEVRE